MFGSEKKKLLIVHEKSTTSFANLLSMLLNSFDDEEEAVVGVKDGSVETGIWTEEQYVAQKPTLSGSDYVLFIGKSKIIDQECYGMTSQYLQYGMQYSSLGRRAHLCVVEGLKENDYPEFIDLSSKYNNNVEEKLKIIGKGPKAIEMVGAGAAGIGVGLMSIPGVGPAVVAGAVIPQIFANAKKRKALSEQQYHCLILKFYYDDVSNFLR